MSGTTWVRIRHAVNTTDAPACLTNSHMRLYGPGLQLPCTLSNGSFTAHLTPDPQHHTPASQAGLNIYQTYFLDATHRDRWTDGQVKASHISPLAPAAYLSWLVCQHSGFPSPDVFWKLHNLSSTGRQASTYACVITGNRSNKVCMFPDVHTRSRVQHDENDELGHRCALLNVAPPTHTYRSTRARCCPSGG